MAEENKILSFPKEKTKVLLLENIHDSAKQAFLNEGYQVESLDSGISDDELKSRFKDVSILGIQSSTKLTEAIQ